MKNGDLSLFSSLSSLFIHGYPDPGRVAAVSEVSLPGNRYRTWSLTFRNLDTNVKSRGKASFPRLTWLRLSATILPGSSRSIYYESFDKMSEILLRADLPGLPEPRRGKVRDVFELDDQLLIVTSDRISAFDVVLGEAIPDKGRVLNSLSLFWFNHFSAKVNHHALDSSWEAMPDVIRSAGAVYKGRVLRARKAEPLPVEWIVRGFITGSLWEQYSSGEPLKWDLNLPRGLKRGEQLNDPVFTPSTKAQAGHDLPLSLSRMEELVGKDLAEKAQALSIELFKEVSARALEKGVILVDTKLEWGLIDGELTLIDECFTPDSSRFLLAETYRPGEPLLPYDKQLIRDFLLASSWDKKSPPTALPDEIIQETRMRYLTIHKRIAGGVPEGMVS